MILHKDGKMFRDSILATAQHLGIPEVYIEKDYWVSLVLKELFTSELSSQVVFKGGTSLSKCHNLIQRFSEDIDLVVFRIDDEADNQLTKRLKKIGKIILVPQLFSTLLKKYGHPLKVYIKHPSNIWFLGNYRMKLICLPL